MYFEEVKLCGFGCFNREINIKFLPERTNLILGSNERGKSTILRGIGGIIYGLKDPSIHKSWTPNPEYWGEVSLDVKGIKHIIRRDFSSETVEWKVDGKTIFHGNANPRGRTEDVRKYIQLLQKYLSIETKATFSRVYYMSQLRREQEIKIGEDIRKRLSGSTEADYISAYKYLEEEYFKMTTENPWGTRKRNARIIEQLIEKLDKTKQQFSQMESLLFQKSEAEKQLSLLLQNHNKIKQELESKEKVLKNISDLLSLRQNEKDIKENLSRMIEEREKYEKAQIRLEETKNRLKTDYGFLEYAPPDLPEKIRNLESLKENLEEHKKLAEQASLKLPTPDVTEPVALNFPIAITIILGLLFGFGDWLITRNFPFIGILSGLVLGGLIGSGYYMYKKSLMKSKLKMENDRLEEIKLEAQNKYMESESRYKESWKEFSHLLENRSSSELLNSWDKKLNIKNEIDKNLAVLESLTIPDKEKYQELLIEAATLKERIESILNEVGFLKNAELKDIGNLESEIRREVQNLKEKDQQVSVKIKQLEMEIVEYNARNMGVSESDRDTIMELEEDLEKAILHKDALALALETLKECETEFQTIYREQLSKIISFHMDRITSSKHNKVELGTDFSPVMMDGEKEIDNDCLSQGTQDQLYFATRIALAEQMGGIEPLPFFMDDTLVNFDDSRLEVTRQILEKISKVHQVIFCTHDRKYSSWGHTAIDLNSTG